MRQHSLRVAEAPTSNPSAVEALANTPYVLEEPGLSWADWVTRSCDHHAGRSELPGPPAAQSTLAERHDETAVILAVPYPQPKLNSLGELGLNVGSGADKIPAVLTEVLEVGAENCTESCSEKAAWVLPRIIPRSPSSEALEATEGWPLPAPSSQTGLAGHWLGKRRGAHRAPCSGRPHRHRASDISTRLCIKVSKSV